MNTPPDLTKGKFWAVKLPSYIYDAWLDAQEKSDANNPAHFANIQIQTVGSTKRMRFTLRDPEEGAPASAPLFAYSKTQRPTFPSFVFSELEPIAGNLPPVPGSRYVESSRRFRYEEEVKGTVEIKPENTEEYRQFSIKRLKRKQTELVSNIETPVFRDDVGSMITPSVHQEAAQSRKLEKKEAAAKTDKRSRCDEGVVYQKLEQLFKEKDEWSQGELAKHIDQPKQHFIEILQTFCVRNEETKMYRIRSRNDILLK